MRSLALLLALSGAACAASVPFVQVLMNAPGVSGVKWQDDQDSYRLTLQPRGAQPMRVFAELGRNTAYPGQHFVFRTISNGFSPAQLIAVQNMVNNVAVKCFNLLPERKQAISNWLAVQNSEGMDGVEMTFGPMKAHFERTGNEDGNFWTSIDFARMQPPGVAPWVNYCKP